MKRIQSVSKAAAMFSMFFFLCNTVVLQAAVSGKIQSMNPLEDGRIELVVNQEGKSVRYLISPKTQITAFVTAEELRSGARVYLVDLSGGGEGGGGGQGFKPPFANWPKSLKKQLHLPEIPGTPSLPQIPSAKTGVPKIPTGPKLPEIPKVPQAPKSPHIPTAQNPVPPAEAAQEPAEGAQKSRAADPVEVEPSEEEKTLFGRVDSANALLKGSGVPEITGVEKTVKNVVKIEDGILVKLESRDGQQEEKKLSANYPVLQKMNTEDLQTNMAVEIEAGPGQEILRIKIVKL